MQYCANFSNLEYWETMVSMTVMYVNSGTTSSSEADPHIYSARGMENGSLFGC